MTMTLDGTSGLTTPGVVNTAGETIATTLVVTGVTTLTGGLNAALPDVPAGKPYKIVDVADIPTDRTFRGAWTWA